MKLTWDEAKRQKTLSERQLDFNDCAKVFARKSYNFPDERKDYGEARNITVGFLRGRMVIIVWTSHRDTRHIISMRKANEREITKYEGRLG
jgi:uncharacterized DUF497 family protein